MKRNPGQRPSLKKLLRNLLRDERGAVLVIATVYLPVILGFFTLAVDMSYVYRTRNTLQVTAEAAALAAASYLPDVAGTATCPVAQLYASTNMPTGSYGNVINNCSDVVVGMWACAVGQTCSAANFVPAATTACGIQCNAVKVTTRMTAANSNALVLAFAPMIGISAFDVTATAIAVYGNDPNAPGWNVGIVQDISGSFSAEVASARDADNALLTCMNNVSGSNSTLAISLFAGTGNKYQDPLSTANTTDANSLKVKIDAIRQCGTGGMQACNGGTDIAAGINKSVEQICPNGACASPTSYKPAIVIMTDGLPNTCNGNMNCGTGTAQANATAAATTAGNMGIDVFTIYWCNDGNCNSTANTNAANWLATLVKNNGKSMKTPTADQMAALMVTGVCKPSHTFRLVW
jgi:Flp pilus assembly protein TadG